MRWFLVLVAALAVLAAAPGFATADEASPGSPVAATTDDGYVPPPCNDPDIATLAVASPECSGEDGVPTSDPADSAALEAAAAANAAAMPSPAELPRYCREHANAYFYTSTEWLRLAQRLAANASPCVDYWISIPALAADKTGGRCVQDDLVRAISPRIHVMAELHFGGWNAWWKKNNKTPREAGLEFVRKWRECGYLQPGETWALNEMHSGIRNDVPGARANMIQFLDAVREASGDQGVAWIIGVGQNTTNVSEYKPASESWLADTTYWQAMSQDVSVWGQEAYSDMRYWGVGDASRHARTSNLSSYLEHPLLLAENGPSSISTALGYLEQTYVPLMSAAWQYTSGFGNTLFPSVDMQRFVSEETFAVKHFSQTRPHAAPDARIAFAWSFTNVCGTTTCTDPATFSKGQDDLGDRIASAIRESYELGGGSQSGACGAPGDHVWCTADISNAAFNPLWLEYPTW